MTTLPAGDQVLSAAAQDAALDAALLSTWNAALERALRDEQPARAVQLAHAVLRHFPRHLPTYHRLVRAAWQLRRWEEGDAWARRLLRADPANALAWRAAAFAAEQQRARAQAQARWLRAFECDPYEPDIRAGLARTNLDAGYLPALTEPCLAALYLRGQRWEHAAALYAALAQDDPRRLDFQCGLLVAHWQGRADREAYALARRLAQAQPHLLLGWVVTDALGDADDRALARHPLQTMDPDSDYVRSVLGLNAPARAVTMRIAENERKLLQSI
jgi:tetratricopeptide (TPR) repeat protein